MDPTRSPHTLKSNMLEYILVRTYSVPPIKHYPTYSHVVAELEMAMALVSPSG